MLLMGDSQQQDVLFWSALMHAILSRSVVSFRKYGDIWMCIGMHVRDAYATRLDNATSRKGLDTFKLPLQISNTNHTKESASQAILSSLWLHNTHRITCIYNLQMFSLSLHFFWHGKNMYFKLFQI
jgi:hypothetical protein